jgi:hypothetical protein
MTTSADIRALVVQGLTGATAAGNAVFSPFDWPTAQNAYPCAYFAPSWTAISRQAGQSFHAKVDTDFAASWTAISREAGQ